MKPRSLALEGLAEKTLDPIALYGTSTLARDAEPQAGALRQGAGIVGAGEEMKDEKPSTEGAALPVDPLEVRAPGEPAPGAAPGGSGRSLHAQVLRRLRPLSRRRLSRARPARVLIRPRNPWDRARLRFLGW
jgi:hypothetical protein